MNLKDFRKSLKPPTRIIGGGSVLVALLALNLLAWLAVYDLSRPAFLEVNFFDVGQGDAIFIETPEKYQTLIDGGPNSAILEKLDGELPFWDNSLDLIILTHPEKDHLAGLLAVLKRYKVKNILWTGVTRDTAEFKEWQRLIQQEKEKEGAQIKIARLGQEIKLGKTVLRILHPFEDLEGREFKDSNNTSVIVKLVFGENSFLFTGDAYKSVEKDVLNRVKHGQIDSDVLKVGHHGSKTSTAPEFIEKVLPEIAVIQCGKDNSYGHPHPETLETLEKYGINILRTDLNGDIKIICDSQSLKVK